MPDICEDPSSCPGVQIQIGAMEKVERNLEENNTKQEQINLNLARVTGAIETQNKLLEVYKKDSDRDLHILFEKSVANEVNLAHVEGNIGIEVATGFGKIETIVAKEVGKLNTSQAMKLGFWDITKIVGLLSGVLILFGALFTLFGG